MVCGAMSADLFAAAVSRFAPAGVVLTAAWRGRRYATALTTGQILTADPGSIMVSVDRRDQIYPAIMRSRALALNILDDHRAALATGRRADPDVDEERLLAAGAWVTSDAGLPVLNEAAATLECHVETTTSMRSHIVLACRIRAVRLLKTSAALARATPSLGQA